MLRRKDMKSYNKDVATLFDEVADRVVRGVSECG